MIAININNQEFEVREIRDVAVYMLRILTRHALYSPLNILKENTISMCELIVELCDIHRRRNEKKNACTQVKRKMNSLIRFIVYKKTNEDVHRMLYDSILSLEGTGLLPGFQYGSKVHKGNKPHGNAEKMSVRL